MREKSNLPTVIVGGCGFIGSNLAENLLRSGERVTIIDNLSRPGVSQNLDWLKELHGDQLSVNGSDIRDPQAIDAIISEAGDRKSTRLNSSHVKISYAVFCLKKITIADKVTSNLAARV